jgi:hypothetical protein
MRGRFGEGKDREFDNIELSADQVLTIIGCVVLVLVSIALVARWKCKWEKEEPPKFGHGFSYDAGEAARAFDTLTTSSRSSTSVHTAGQMPSHPRRHPAWLGSHAAEAPENDYVPPYPGPPELARLAPDRCSECPSPPG